MSKLWNGLKKIFIPDKSKALILLYHRIAELSTDPQLLATSLNNFDDQLKYIKEKYNPVTLTELTSSIMKREIPDRTIAITFDDGYADNLWNAASILEKYGVPATIFVTTGYVGQKREFWWDDLERIILLPDRLPKYFSLDINGKFHEWDLSKENSGNYDDRLDNKSSDWNVTLNKLPTPYHRLYMDLNSILRPLGDAERKKIIEDMAAWAGVSDECREDYRCMDKEELIRISKSGLIDIGAHTITHPVLSNLSIEEQKVEILGSKMYLEKILGHSVKSFSYPFGCPSDIGKNAMKSVRVSNFESACANYESPVLARANRYSLPRYIVRNWSIDEFAQHLDKWFYG